MPKTKSTRQKDNKTKVYECAHYEFECDDLGKYCWCNNTGMPNRNCELEYIYCHQFCPGYKKGKLRGAWVVSADEIKVAENFRRQMEQERKNREIEERALLKHLKEKYEP